MALDARGDISAFVIAVYVPILLISLLVAFRHGFTRRAGWVLLVVVSLIRILGGSLHIAAEEVRPINTSLYIAYAILETVGLSPLLIATIGFLKTVSVRAFDDMPLVTNVLRIMTVISTVGFIMVIVGGTDASAANPNDGSTLRHVGVILLAVVYVLIVLTHFFFWSQRDRLLLHRRSLLLGISTALPFLAIRVLYAILSGFAPQSYGPTHTTSSSPLAKFNSSGPWGYWLGLSVFMELATVLIYVVTGLLIPLAADKDASGMSVDDEASANDEEMSPRRRPLSQWRQRR